MLGAILISVGGIYLLYRAYNIRYKHDINRKDNGLLDETMLKDKEGYCKWLSRYFNIMGLVTLLVGILSFMDGFFFNLGYYIYIIYGVLIAVFIICSVLISKGMKKFY